MAAAALKIVRLTIGRMGEIMPDMGIYDMENEVQKRILKTVKDIRVSITPDNDIPAFAGYLSGSVHGPEVKVVVNIEAMVNAAADKENEISFKEIFVTSVVHEILHAVEDLYHRNFDEEEVERVLTEAAELHYDEIQHG